MAIKKSVEIGNTGAKAEHWVLLEVVRKRQGNTNVWSTRGTFAVWHDAAAFAAGKDPMPGPMKTVEAEIDGNPSHGQLQAALHAAARAEGGPLADGEDVS